jgi:hypothetical protein
VIYVIAAYTITLSVLAIYGMLLQHRGRVFAADQDATRTADAVGLARGFNLGAALLSPLWMWKHGMRLPGSVLLAFFAAMVLLYEREMWIPFLFVAMVPIAAGAALGFVGNRIAASHRGDESVAELSTNQLPWATAGIVLYALVLPWTWYFLYASP